jgi:hypothetical protein
MGLGAFNLDEQSACAQPAVATFARLGGLTALPLESRFELQCSRQSVVTR